MKLEFPIDKCPLCGSKLEKGKSIYHCDNDTHYQVEFFSDKSSCQRVGNYDMGVYLLTSSGNYKTRYYNWVNNSFTYMFEFNYKPISYDLINSLKKMIVFS